MIFQLLLVVGCKWGKDATIEGLENVSRNETQDIEDDYCCQWHT